MGFPLGAKELTKHFAVWTELARYFSAVTEDVGLRLPVDLRKKTKNFSIVIFTCEQCTPVLFINNHKYNCDQHHTEGTSRIFPNNFSIDCSSIEHLSEGTRNAP
jgi:hypothetical protein